MRPRLATLLALCAAVGLSQESGATLLGKWRSVETSNGGIGAVVDFHADGTFDYMPGAVLGGRYREEGKQIIITPENGEPAYPQVLDTLSASAMRLGMLDFVRVGKPEAADKLLLGVWRTVRSMPSAPGSHGYYYFRPDGRETFFIPFLTERCSYSVSGGRIRLTNRQGSKEGPMQWDGKILTVPWGRGDATFERF